MRRFIASLTLAAVCASALLVGVAVVRAQEGHEMPPPAKENDWFKPIMGEWETVTEMVMEPGKPPVTCKGTQTSRSLGGYWVMFEHTGDMMGSPMTGIMTLGWDAAQKAYVGTWVDSMTPTLWRYKGTLDATGKILTLDTEGPSQADPAKLAPYRDIIEVKGPDHKTLTAMAKVDDKWITIMTVHMHRKK